ncbi:LysR substrate-binding domain-containing protein [Pedobacter sp.]|uniref:LysR substrate-binding domain-containing protein n=1 Tax=Pedobacter sp. TaxID=1411316 RepID=UPI003D7FD23F
MNIQQLEYIIAVDHFKNFTKAAARCFVTQATLSAMVKKLEEELEVILFDRTPQGVFTTNAGKEIIEEAKKVILHSQLLIDRAKEIHGKIEGKVKVGIIPTIANTLLPLIVKPILDTYPHLSLEIFELTTDVIVKQLKNGDLDIGILATPINYEEIEKVVLFEEALMVYGDVSTDKKYIMPEEIKSQKIWLFEEGHCLRDQFIKLCSLKKKENTVKNLQLKVSSFETLLNMVDEFGGLTLIPELYYKILSEEKKIKVTFFNTPIPVREMSIVYYKPYSKIKIIEALAKIIRLQVRKDLIADQYHAEERAIVRT